MGMGNLPVSYPFILNLCVSRGDLEWKEGRTHFSAPRTPQNESVSNGSEIGPEVLSPLVNRLASIEALDGRMKVGKRTKISRRGQQRGFSLLEMVAAATLMTAILVPALGVMRDAMAKSRDMNHRNVLSLHAQYFLEIFVGLAANNWTVASNFTASFPIAAPDGYGSIRAKITLSDDPANGGLPNQLSHVQVTAYDDVNGNASLDANEPQVNYRTKVAKLDSYENEEQ